MATHSSILSWRIPVAGMVKNLPAMQETWVWSLEWEDSPEEENGYPLHYSCLENSMDRGAWWATVHGVAKSWTQLSTHAFLPGASNGKKSACNAGEPGSIPGLGRSPREGNGHPLQYSCLENPMDWTAWWATVHRVSRVEQDWAISLSLSPNKSSEFPSLFIYSLGQPKKKIFFFKIFGVWTIFLKSLSNSLPYCFYIFYIVLYFGFLAKGHVGPNPLHWKSKSPPLDHQGSPLSQQIFPGHLL